MKIAAKYTSDMLILRGKEIFIKISENRNFYRQRVGDRKVCDFVTKTF